MWCVVGEMLLNFTTPVRRAWPGNIFAKFQTSLGIDLPLLARHNSILTHYMDNGVIYLNIGWRHEWVYTHARTNLIFLIAWPFIHESVCKIWLQLSFRIFRKLQYYHTSHRKITRLQHQDMLFLGFEIFFLKRGAVSLRQRNSVAACYW